VHKKRMVYKVVRFWKLTKMHKEKIKHVPISCFVEADVNFH
jgi:hypothetical protein